MDKNILAAFICFLTVLLVCTQSFAITIDDLADIFEALERHLQDIHIEFEWDNDPPMNVNDIKGRSLLIAKGPRKCTWTTKRPFNEFSMSTEEATFMNEYEDSWIGKTKQSYNGKVAKHLQTGSRLHKNRLSGTVTKSNRFIHDTQFTPAGYSILHFSNSTVYSKTPLSEFLRNKEKEFIHLDENIKNKNGFKTIRVDIFQKQTKILCGSVYFSVEHGYTPVSYEYYGNDANGNTELKLFCNVTSLEKISDGVWFPSVCRRGSPNIKRCDVFKTTKIILNQGLQDEYFDFEFPPGTKIRDEILGLTYVYKPTQDNFDKFLEDIELIEQQEAEEKKVYTKTLQTVNQKSEITNGNRSTSPLTVNSQQQENPLQAQIRPLIYVSLVIAAVLLTLLIIRKHLQRGGACP